MERFDRPNAPPPMQAKAEGGSGKGLDGSRVGACPPKAVTGQITLRPLQSTTAIAPAWDIQDIQHHQVPASSKHRIAFVTDGRGSCDQRPLRSGKPSVIQLSHPSSASRPSFLSSASALTDGPHCNLARRDDDATIFLLSIYCTDPARKFVEKGRSIH
ncbi:hypothetical protein E4U38_005826 [Claviceps purpurea]|nr:hypothetical protein E4U38_005826 [Claviceps purpurea]